MHALQTFHLNFRVNGKLECKMKMLSEGEKGWHFNSHFFIRLLFLPKYFVLASVLFTVSILTTGPSRVCAESLCYDSKV